MAKPLRSKFITDKQVDTRQTLFSGRDTITAPVLIESLSVDETERLLVDNSTGATNRGFVVIDDEVIAYTSRFG